MNKAVKERFHLFEWKVKVNSLLVVSPLPERGGGHCFFVCFLAAEPEDTLHAYLNK